MNHTTPSKLLYSLTLAALLTPALATADIAPPQPEPRKPVAAPVASSVPVPAPAAAPVSVSPPTSEQDGRQTAFSATLILKVIHPDEVRKQAIAQAKAHGGFPILVTDNDLHLKLPPDQLGPMVDALSKQGIVLQKSLQRADRGELIAQLEHRLRSKQEILERLRGFLGDSNVQATLRIEQSMSQLVGEVEALRGELEVERASVRHARLVVSFQFNRQSRITYVQSPFDWLNTVDLDRFLQEF